MVKGGVEAEVAALLAHIDGASQPSVARVAARGMVQILRSRRALPNPLAALRRRLVGVPCAAVDEVAGASAALVQCGAFDANVVVAELLAALAANAAERAASGATRGSGPGSTPVAGALVRGVALVVAACAGPSAPAGAAASTATARPDDPWAGRSAPPRARPPRAPVSRAPAVLAAVTALLGVGPESAAALSRATPRQARRARMRSFLRHALLDDTHDARAFRGRTSRASRPHRSAPRSLSPRPSPARSSRGCVAWSRPNLGVEGGGGFAASPRGRRGRARGGGIRRHDGHRRVRCRRRGGGGGERRGRAFTISTTR